MFAGKAAAEHTGYSFVMLSVCDDEPVPDISGGRRMVAVKKDGSVGVGLTRQQYINGLISCYLCARPRQLLLLRPGDIFVNWL